MKSISVPGVRNVLIFANDMPNSAEFMTEDEDENMSDFFLQSAIAKTIDQITHAISQVLDARPSGTLGLGWIPSASTALPPEDNTPLSATAQARFLQRNPGALDSEVDFASTSGGSTASVGDAGVTGLSFGTLISSDGFSASDSPRSGIGSTFHFILPG